MATYVILHQIWIALLLVMRQTRQKFSYREHPHVRIVFENGFAKVRLPGLCTQSLCQASPDCLALWKDCCASIFLLPSRKGRRVGAVREMFWIGGNVILFIFFFSCLEGFLSCCCPTTLHLFYRIIGMVHEKWGKKKKKKRGCEGTQYPHFRRWHTLATWSMADC